MPGRNARSGSISRPRFTVRGSRATRCPASGTHSAPSASLRCAVAVSSNLAKGEQKANRDTPRLEIAVTQTK